MRYDVTFLSEEEFMQSTCLDTRSQYMVAEFIKYEQMNQIKTMFNGHPELAKGLNLLEIVRLARPRYIGIKGHEGPYYDKVKHTVHLSNGSEINVTDPYEIRDLLLDDDQLGSLINQVGTLVKKMSSSNSKFDALSRAFKKFEKEYSNRVTT